MKKLLLVLSAALVLVACGSKPNEEKAQVLECVTEELGMEMAIALEIEKEAIKNMSMNMKMPYAVLGTSKEEISDEDKKEAEAEFNDHFSEFGEASVEFEEDSMSIFIKLNDKGLEQTDLFANSELSQKVDINEMKAEAESNGGTCTIK